MYCLTTIRSITRVRTGVIDIGRKSAGCCGVVSFGIGLIHACFHCTGTVEVRSDRLNITVAFQCSRKQKLQNYGVQNNYIDSNAKIKGSTVDKTDTLQTVLCSIWLIYEWLCD